ncbi:MAG: hypothetical protein Ct9H300mP3_00410 [Gammaproteobacteria bacterium]|nr:MAG: hypothetical protein Ct9H300mP3_00410 [Gammaproteobacteria bacterium]
MADDIPDEILKDRDPTKAIPLCMGLLNLKKNKMYNF